jgi:hypothetical protein
MPSHSGSAPPQAEIACRPRGGGGTRAGVPAGRERRRDGVQRERDRAERGKHMQAPHAKHLQTCGQFPARSGIDVEASLCVWDAVDFGRESWRGGKRHARYGKVEMQVRGAWRGVGGVGRYLSQGGYECGTRSRGRWATPGGGVTRGSAHGADGGRFLADGFGGRVQAGKFTWLVRL